MADTTKFTFTLTAATGYAGEYEWDVARPFNGDDWHLMKQEAGVRMGEFDDALVASDYDLILTLAAIMLRRAGKATHAQLPAIVRMLRGLDVGAVDLEQVEAEDDDRPPASATLTGSSSESVAPPAENGSSTTSSPVSNGIGVGLPETPQSPTGHPGSAIGAA